ncbi:MAG: type II secretion system F family protein [Gammaproteobacteria bacterium]|nr:type II secretion system F family protein [Gammaproteobacteria bacterium]
MTNAFYYQGRNTNGKTITGNIEANKLEEVVSHLNQQGITPINITPIKKLPFKSLNLSAILSSFGIILHKVEPYRIMNFCRQLAILNEAGLSIIKSINKLSQSTNSAPLRKVLSQVANDIAAGTTLSDALKRHPDTFSPILINIINIGENTGRLNEALKHLGDYIEASIANRRRLISAIRYPIFVLIAATAAIFVMNFLVIPKFSLMFAKFNLELPLATRIIIGSSDFMINNKIILTASFIIIFFGIKRLLKIPGVHYFWDKNKLHLPVFGNLQKRILLSQFTWTFSLILRSGVPIIKGINLASNSTENLYFSVQLLKMRSAIEHGENLSRASIASGLFTPMTIQMIEVGEESEKLDESLAEIAKYYDAEIDYDLRRLNELVEPILLIAIGGIVLILALGIYFPLWDLIKIAKI